MSIFSRVPTKPTGSSKKRLTPVNTMSFNFGGIYPVFCKNVMPGDTWKMNIGSFLRTVPLISPVMHRCDLKVDAFFVPYRLIWKSAEEWFACNEAVIRPKLYCATGQTYNSVLGVSSLTDYFGFGTPKLSDLLDNNIDPSNRKVDVMPFRAYRMIYDFYFRNKSLEDDVTVDFPDFYGDDDFVIPDDPNPSVVTKAVSAVTLKLRPWRRDIFTSALPDPQNGPDVAIPQADLDIVADDGLVLKDTDGASQGSVQRGRDGSYLLRSGSSQADIKNQQYESGLKTQPENIPTMRKLRAANLMEEFEEAMARIGYNAHTVNTGKFKEWLAGIWNVRSSDSRLDIPEWLGGYRGPISISEIPQTSGSTQDSPQGNLAGKGISAGGSRIFGKKFFEEPGIMMVLVSVVPKSAYCQGDPREWLYESGFDYPNPYFEPLGEQEVFSQEINCLAPLLPDYQKTWGYNVRNYEMKSYPDEIHGAFRDSLAFWHLGRMFDWSNIPGLNPFFTHVRQEDASRIFPSTEDSDKLLAQFFFDITLKRKLNPYGIPHFSNF